MLRTQVVYLGEERKLSDIFHVSKRKKLKQGTQTAILKHKIATQTNVKFISQVILLLVCCVDNEK